MSNAKRKEQAKLGRGTAGKTAVAGVKDRAMNRVKAKVVPNTTKNTLQDFVAEYVAPRAKVFTDDVAAYEGMLYVHYTVVHSIHEYVKGGIHINGLESIWSR